MDCGIPFCHQGCPLGNLIPDWNDLVYRDHWREAIDRLHATNNFPEFTGHALPRPCEGSCVLGINDDPVTIKPIEVAIIDRAFDEGWVAPEPPGGPDRQEGGGRRLGPRRARRGPAAQPRRATAVTVFERADRIGGLLRYGIPEFKMEKRVLDRRLEQMEAEGVALRDERPTSASTWTAERLRQEFDAIVLAGGAGEPARPADPRARARRHPLRDGVPHRSRTGAARATRSPTAEFITARDKHVVIIGGGDTGADCLGTVHRQGARSVHQFEILPRPPDQRAPDNPWPQWPNIFRVSSAHEEGGERVYAVSTKRFLGDDAGASAALEAVRVEMVREGGRLGLPGRPRHGVHAAVRPGAPGHGLPRARSARACSSSSA